MPDPNLPSNSHAVPFGLDDLDYDLPRSLIAQQPARRRDEARLLVLGRDSDRLHDGTIRDLPELLREGDLLVLNDTKVIPAKFHARRDTGGRVEGLFLSEESPRYWRIMLRGSRRLECGQTLTIEPRVERVGELGAERTSEPGVAFTLIEYLGEGQWLVEPNTRQSSEIVLERIGETPLPPYIHRCDDKVSGGALEDDEDRLRYQTVYARHVGSIAAPTAGLHFTHDLLEQIRKRGIETTTVTLHVGVGTFKPIKVGRIQEHRMLAEHFEITDEAAQAVAQCRARGGRVVAVGTTTVRTLEAARCDVPVDRGVRPGRASTDLFVFPPYRFRVVDTLLTNFHLPGSTLLALVMAFAGVDRTRRAYRHAVEEAYRFYSYGDAMFII